MRDHIRATRTRVLPAALIATLVALASLGVPTAGRAAEPVLHPIAPPGRAAAGAASLQGAMRRPVSLDVSGLPLDRALAILSRAALVPIDVDWDSLSGLGIEREAPVTLRLRDVPADHLLALAFRAAGGREPVTWLDAGGLHVAAEHPTAADADGSRRPTDVVEVAYDVGDLLRLAPRWFDSHEAVCEDLSRLVMETVASDSWAETGGSLGRIRVGLAKPDDGSGDGNANPAPPRRPGAAEPLVVTTTPQYQSQVAELLAQVRGALAGQPSARTFGADRAAQALRRPVPAAFKALPLDDALEMIRRTSGLNLFIDWKSFEAVGIDRKALVTTKAPRGEDGTAPGGEALSAVLAAVGTDAARVGFDTDADGVVHVASADVIGQIVVTRCYGVLPLLVTHRPSKAWPPESVGRERLEAIQKVITDGVVPDSWRDNGGQAGSIRSFGWVLVVTQTPENQEKVAAVLQALP